ncbi:amidase [Nocardioides dokdonensis]|uniref:amidase n=1 Tax=Nocardioides dokdonensis TaxID=450734 RepID=UPI0009FC5C2F|nr:amidase [Nocardioides dokdonensis]
MPGQDATALAAAIRDGELSAREAVEASIARIERLDPGLNAVIGTRFEAALEDVERGLPPGPLTGVPTLVKPLAADVAGLPSAGGSRLFADVVAQQDSELVRRYRAAGMVVLGTTNTPELGKNGTSTEPLLHGPTRNPWDTSRSTGGSSGGSAAAVSAGLVPVAHGNDGGGSIRIPAAMCGLLGLKPSRGRVPGAPYDSSLAGPVSVHHVLSTSVRDSALLLDLTSTTPPGALFAAPSEPAGFLARMQAGPGRLRIGVATTVPDGPDTDPECAAAVRRAADLLDDLGHEVVETELRYRLGEVLTCSGRVMGAGLVALVDDRLQELGRELREDDIEPFTRAMYERYSTLSAADLVRALQGFERIAREMGTTYADLDVVLTPTLARPTPELGVADPRRPDTMYEHGRLISAYTSICNVTGAPAVSVPFGTDERGMPIGVQVIADLGGEGLLLALAAQLEQAAPWPTHAPFADPAQMSR